MPSLDLSFNAHSGFFPVLTASAKMSVSEIFQDPSAENNSVPIAFPLFSICLGPSLYLAFPFNREL